MQDSGWLDKADENGILFAMALDGKGGGKLLERDVISEEIRNEGLAWVHLDREHPGTREWLQREITYLDPLILDALLAEETRPRLVELDQGMMVILRGINHNEGAEPHDMISVRMWIDPIRIITVRRRRSRSTRDLREKLQMGRGPKNSGDFLWGLCARLFEHIEPVLGELDDSIDGLEEQILESPEQSLSEGIIDARKQAITLRRYIAPQKDVIANIKFSEQKWLTATHRRHLQESYDRLTRYVEDLDALRERAQVVKDELSATLAGRLNRNTYILSIITSIFIPMTFITGLLGMNVEGIPNAAHHNAFWIVTCMLGSVMAFQFVFFRWRRWF